MESTVSNNESTVERGLSTSEMQLIYLFVYKKMPHFF